MKKTSLLIPAFALLMACGGDKTNDGGNAGKALQDSVQAYLDAYTRKYQELSIIDNEAEWRSNTHIVEGDTTNSSATNKAEEEMARFTGSTENIETARKYLAQKDKLTALQSKRSDKSAVILTPEQEQELDHFQDEKLRIRKQLRQVRANLESEINSLGVDLKILNIIVVPFAFAIIAFLVAVYRRKQRLAAASHKENTP